ncbi:hypothetical protein [Chryseobacterium indoltheticum]|uniref:Uncharacterized protein n=1 Tax=Chryseobacterium indoltheticum TaxID=254 RepID=A0A381FHB6_9FLAO|nr:hypothetical protein [Chryseobacterium indoltheticum]AZA74745.1 hypothetical protein EG358_13660 [Chryseobacterium indoltheticum]SIQ36804.1 hypothetical protein SAMN05421682_104239 [Chryseobacterium indoltheticum]SUX45940.1 Uncharacterised protein [Chryseobacterium indoltheticum]
MKGILIFLICVPNIFIAQNKKDQSKSPGIFTTSYKLCDISYDFEIFITINTDKNIRYKDISFHAMNRIIYDFYAKFLYSENGESVIERILVENHDKGFSISAEYKDAVKNRYSYFTYIYDFEGKHILNQN